MNPSEKHRRPATVPTCEPLDDIGGEPLEHSGFEHETPDPDFTESAPQTVQAAPPALAAPVRRG